MAEVAVLGPFHYYLPSVRDVLNTATIVDDEVTENDCSLVIRDVLQDVPSVDIDSGDYCEGHGD